MSRSLPHLEALRRSSDELRTAIENGDLRRIGAIVERRANAIDALIELRGTISGEQDVMLRVALEDHASNTRNLCGLRDRVAAELERIRHGRAVARAQRSERPPERFVSTRC